MPALISRQGDDIVFSFREGELFSGGANTISAGGQHALASVAALMHRFGQTAILIQMQGSGSNASSAKRAFSVESALVWGSVPLSHIRIARPEEQIGGLHRALIRLHVSVRPLN